ncbi:MAG: glycoside hydrolase family 2 TIM barrel-domain containing protein [Anaerocolumna sp.]
MFSTTLFNDNWKFSKQPLHTTYDGMIKSTGEVSWQEVSLPHDWLIYDVHNLYENSEGWYLKYIEIEHIDENTMTALRFEGIYMNSYLYVNGKEVGTWKYGYSTFEMEITKYLILGINEIMVQVIHEAPNSRWYTGAGIYRNVWLKTYPITHLASDGIYISTKEEKDVWHVNITSEIMLGDMSQSKIIQSDITQHNSYQDQLELLHMIHDMKGNLISSMQETLTHNLYNTNVSNNIITHKTTLDVNNPKLWNLEFRTLYTLTTRLLKDKIVLDETRQNFGFRTLTFDSRKGFLLNHTPVKIHGVCEHHDLGCLGAAVNKTAVKRKLTILKEMGVNAIRTAHNMPAVELMDLADEMGFLIVSEAFDMWERSKTAYDYSRFFKEWAPLDIASWIRRDRNHPSLIMWSIGNEIYDTHADERGQEITRWLYNLVEHHDPLKNGFCTIGSNYMPWDNAQKCADIVKLAGYNYAEKYYDKHHLEHPDWIIYGSETASTVQSRGIYHFPLSQSILADDDEQCSSLGNSSTSWGAKSTENCITDDRNATYSPGQFIWTGFDYIGEPTPYHTKNSYFGQIDTAGFKKDSYYIYQAEWTDYKRKPMVHIFPYWDFSPGQIIDVRVCSNAPKIELFFNSISLGTHLIDHKEGNHLLGHWQINYKEGTLRAVAYDENDSIIAEDIKTSFQDASTLQMTTDTLVLSANGTDLVFVEISALDNDNNMVWNANNRVNITVSGPGVLVGLDNGDSTDYDQYKGYSRKMFSGKLLAVISSTFDSGVITIKAESLGLESAALTIPTTPANLIPGTCEPIVFSTSSQKEEIPIRKLEILCPKGNEINEKYPIIQATVKIHPACATYNDVLWRATNIAGIDSTIARIDTSGNDVTITGIFDGTLYLRCQAKNGADKITLYSQIEIPITGLGTATLNPYHFICAGLYSFGTNNLTNGNERGMATARDGQSIIGYENMDFGSFGSDEITLPIFSLDSEVFPIEIWEGTMDSGHGKKITTLTYQKPSIWNVYQEETYKLPRKLTGLTSLYFVLNRKIHLKGFYFNKIEKAYTRLHALDYTHLYGDSYNITETALENIGNNVSIVFDQMDFGENGFTTLTIYGHSPIVQNTLQIRFQGGMGETLRILEFTYSDNYVAKTFELEPVLGLQTVTFVFLPGSKFDLKWFQFE